MSFSEIRDALAPIRTICGVEPLTIDPHHRAVEIAERYGFSIYDATIVAAALSAGCGTLYSEDVQDGQASRNLQYVILVIVIKRGTRNLSDTDAN